MADEHEHEEGYTGPAVITVDEREVPVHARLDSRFEPHDGKLHWYGRVRPHEEIDIPGGRVEVRTDEGRAAGRIGEIDPWGRYRVTGVGAPPYALDTPDT